MVAGNKIKNMVVTSLALATLAGSLTGCVLYTPGPRRVAYVAPAPVVVMHPYYAARVVVR